MLGGMAAIWCMQVGLAVILLGLIWFDLVGLIWRFGTVVRCCEVEFVAP